MKRGCREVGKAEGDKWWWKETWLWVVNTPYNMQMMYYRIVTWNLYNFINQCHPNKSNKKGGKCLTFGRSTLKINHAFSSDFNLLNRRRWFLAISCQKLMGIYLQGEEILLGGWTPNGVKRGKSLGVRASVYFLSVPSHLTEIGRCSSLRYW